MTVLKECRVCFVQKPKTEFNKHNKRKDGLQLKCRDCSNRMSKEHFNLNKEYYNEKARLFRNTVKDIIGKLKSGPCKDCRVSYPPYVMQFDHIDPKKKTEVVSSMINRGCSLEKIKSEIKKCDLVCANCHAERTHRMFGRGNRSVKRINLT